MEQLSNDAVESVLIFEYDILPETAKEVVKAYAETGRFVPGQLVDEVAEEIYSDSTFWQGEL